MSYVCVAPFGKVARIDAIPAFPGGVKADGAGQTIALRRFRADIARNRLIVGPAIEEKHFQVASRLLRVHAIVNALRTLDAIQLAVALDLRQTGWISVLIASDRRLCAVAEISGCPAIDPVNPGGIHR